MALGGGTFTFQNKVLPGSYINFVSAAAASASLSDRGYAALALPLHWGPEHTVITVTKGDFYQNSFRIFGYGYTHEALAGLRDLFLYASTCYLYRLDTGGTAAENRLARALYPGIRGNDITLVVKEEEDGFSVLTYVDGALKDTQTAADASSLTDNDFVTFDPDALLEATAGLPLTGGADGVVLDDTYQGFLNAMEGYSFQTLGCLSPNDTVKKLFASYTNRMRDEVGVKFQCVLYRYPDADSEGVISVQNAVGGDDTDTSMVYWVTGAAAGCPLNRSNTNRLYNGEFDVDTNNTQAELENFIKSGIFAFHLVSGQVRVLEDINTFVSVTDEKSADFSLNQTIRVLDQIATDIAALFCTKYLGKIQNDNAGRISLWNDIVTHHQALEAVRAIEDFDPANVIVSVGDSKRSVIVTDLVTPVCAMSQLYMTVVVA